MARICMVTGKKLSFGKKVSFSHKRSSRRWIPNIQKKRYWVPSQRRYVTLTVSTKGIKTIDRKGIEAVIADMRRRGIKV